MDKRTERVRLLLVFLTVSAVVVGMVLLFEHNQRQAQKDACESISQITPQDCSS